MKTLILFSTRDGQTREIASFLASELKELGIDADTLNLNRTDVVEWHHYDQSGHWRVDSLRALSSGGGPLCEKASGSIAGAAGGILFG